MTSDQLFDFPRLQGRGRLVHDHDAVVGVDRAGDRDHLLHAETELAEGPPDVDLDPIPGEARLRLRVHPCEVDQSEAIGRFATEEEVPRDAHAAAPG